MAAPVIDLTGNTLMQDLIVKSYINAVPTFIYTYELVPVKDLISGYITTMIPDHNANDLIQVLSAIDAYYNNTVVYLP